MSARGTPQRHLRRDIPRNKRSIERTCTALLRASGAPAHFLPCDALPHKALTDLHHRTTHTHTHIQASRGSRDCKGCHRRVRARAVRGESRHYTRRTTSATAGSALASSGDSNRTRTIRECSRSRSRRSLGRPSPPRSVLSLWWGWDGVEAPSPGSPLIKLNRSRAERRLRRGPCQNACMARHVRPHSGAPSVNQSIDRLVPVPNTHNAHTRRWATRSTGGPRRASMPRWPPTTSASR